MNFELWSPTTFFLLIEFGIMPTEKRTTIRAMTRKLFRSEFLIILGYTDLTELPLCDAALFLQLVYCGRWMVVKRLVSQQQCSLTSRLKGELELFVIGPEYSVDPSVIV